MQAYEGLSKSFLKWEMFRGKNSFALTEKEQSRKKKKKTTKKQGPDDSVKVLQSHSVAIFALMNDNAAASGKTEKLSSEPYM